MTLHTHSVKLNANFNQLIVPGSMGKLIGRLAFIPFGVPSASNRDIRFADFAVLVHGARVLASKRAWIASTPLIVPVAVRICGAERRIAYHAILRCRTLKCTRAHRDQDGNQCNNHASHESAATVRTTLRWIIDHSRTFGIENGPGLCLLREIG